MYDLSVLVGKWFPPAPLNLTFKFANYTNLCISSNVFLRNFIYLSLRKKRRSWKKYIDMGIREVTWNLNIRNNFQYVDLCTLHFASISNFSLSILLQCIYWNLGHPDNENQSEGRTETIDSNQTNRFQLIKCPYKTMKSQIVLNQPTT